jgi:hypothetical protein
VRSPSTGTVVVKSGRRDLGGKCEQRLQKTWPQGVRRGCFSTAKNQGQRRQLLCTTRQRRWLTPESDGADEVLVNTNGIGEERLIITIRLACEVSFRFRGSSRFGGLLGLSVQPCLYRSSSSARNLTPAGGDGGWDGEREEEMLIIELAFF